jgi:hypothetical protein
VIMDPTTGRSLTGMGKVAHCFSSTFAFASSIGQMAGPANTSLPAQQHLSTLNDLSYDAHYNQQHCSQRSTLLPKVLQAHLSENNYCESVSGEDEIGSGCEDDNNPITHLTCCIRLLGGNPKDQDQELWDG